MKSIDDIKKEIKTSERFIIDVLNSMGANLKNKRRGSTIASGRCVLHGGDGENLHVIEKDSEYYIKCQSKCKFYGDVFEVLKEAKGLDFIESIKYIIDEFNLGYNLNNIKMDKLEKLKHDLSFKKVYKDRNTVDNDYEFKTSYIYKDAQGTPLYAKVRFELKKPMQNKNKKTFRNYRIIDDGEKYISRSGLDWREGKEAKSVNRVLYNLPGIVKARNENKTIFIVEGEKDADNLIKLGFAATTTVSSKAWIKEYNEYFLNAKVVVIGDNDATGKEHIEVLKSNLLESCSSFKIVKLPMDEEKSDISDYIDYLRKQDKYNKNVYDAILKLIDRSLDLKNKYELQQDKNGIYYTKVKETEEGTEETQVYITNFKIDHAYIYRSIDTDDQKIELKLTSVLGKTETIKADARTLFTDVKTFRKVLGIDFVYNSNGQFLPKLQTWILKYFIDKDISNYTITGIRSINNENVLITNNGILYPDGRFDTSIKADNNIHDIDFTDIKPLNKEEAEELARHLFNFNKKQIVYNSLGLTVAQLLNSFVRESKLDNLPVLQNIGESNSGKSKTFAIIKTLLNISNKPLAYSNITEFTILRAFNMTYLPLLIDEVKPSKNPIHKLNMLSNHIRNCTEGYKAEKGRKDLSVVEYHYLATMMLSGEELINENAVINRSNISWYSRSNFTKDGADAIEFLVRNDRGNELLRRFSLTLYTQILKRYSSDFIRASYNNIREKFKFDKIEDDRIRNTAIYTFLGMSEIAEAFKSLGVDIFDYIDLKEAKDLIEMNLVENVMDSNEEGQLSEYEEILMLIDRLAGASDISVLISHGEHYKREYDSVFFDLKDIWERLNIYISRYASNVRLMDRKEFQKHIRKSKYIYGSNSSEYYVNTRFAKTTYTKDMHKVEKNKGVKAYKLKASELYSLGMTNIIPDDCIGGSLKDSKVIPFAETTTDPNDERWVTYDDIQKEKELGLID